MQPALELLGKPNEITEVRKSAGITNTTQKHNTVKEPLDFSLPTEAVECSGCALADCCITITNVSGILNGQFWQHDHFGVAVIPWLVTGTLPEEDVGPVTLLRPVTGVHSPENQLASNQLANLRW